MLRHEYSSFSLFCRFLPNQDSVMIWGGGGECWIVEKLQNHFTSHHLYVALRNTCLQSDNWHSTTSWWLVRVTLMVYWPFLPQKFWQVVGTYKGLLPFCECTWGGGSIFRWWGHLNTFCLNQTFWPFALRGGAEWKIASNCMGVRPFALSAQGTRPRTPNEPPRETFTAGVFLLWTWNLYMCRCHILFLQIRKCWWIYILYYCLFRKILFMFAFWFDYHNVATHKYASNLKSVPIESKKYN